jgi:hypothetical protein
VAARFERVVDDVLVRRADSAATAPSAARRPRQQGCRCHSVPNASAKPGATGLVIAGFLLLGMLTAAARSDLEHADCLSVAGGAAQAQRAVCEIAERALRLRRPAERCRIEMERAAPGPKSDGLSIR